MKKIFLLAFASLVLSSCATNITPVATGGSKADGTVTVSYAYGMFEKPVINWPAAERSAKARCNAWGYNSAEAFEGTQENCLAYNGYGNCVRNQVNLVYQCTRP